MGLRVLLAVAIATFARIFPLAAPTTDEHVVARAVADHIQATAGSTIRVGVHFKMEAGWHIYWQNAGASGLPTSIRWNLPKGFAAGPLEWPSPEAIAVEGVGLSYGYEREVLLFTTVRIDKDAEHGRYALAATAKWLVCMEACEAGEATVSTTVTIGAKAERAPDAGVFDRFARLVPKPATAEDRLDVGSKLEGSVDAATGTWIVRLTLGAGESFAERAVTAPIDDPDFTIRSTEISRPDQRTLLITAKVARTTDTKSWSEARPRMVVVVEVEPKKTPPQASASRTSRLLIEGKSESPESRPH